MSGISKGRITKRRDTLKEELDRLQILVAQYQAAIAELDALLEPEAPEAPQNGHAEAIEETISL